MNGRTNTSVVTIDTGGAKVPLEAPTALTTVPMDKKVNLTWKDPLDKYAVPKGETANEPWPIVSKWDHTVIVRKLGSDPTNITDGVRIFESQIRDQYVTNPYSDTNDLVNGSEYHYAAYGVSTDGIVSVPMTAIGFPRDGMFSYMGQQSLAYPSDYGRLFTDFTAAASTENHAIFTGLAKEVGTGAGLDYNRFTPYPSAYVFDESGTKTELPNANNTIGSRTAYSGPIGTSANGYVFFGCGYSATSSNTGTYNNISGSVTIINPSLTVSRANGNSRAYGAAASVGDTAIFYGGIASNYDPVPTASAINSNGTHTPLDNAVTQTCTRAAGSSTNSYAIFTGGCPDELNDQEFAIPVLTAYDSSLTKITNNTATARFQHCGVSNNGRAIFAGGKNYYTNQYGGTCFTTVEYYTDSLTKQTVTGLVIAAYDLAGVSYESNVLFAGGRNFNDSYSNEGRVEATLYDGSFTRKNVDNLTSYRPIKAANAKSLAFFIGEGLIDKYKYQ